MSDLARVFLDTSYFLALTHTGDRHHQRATTVRDQVNQNQSQQVTTEFVLMEFGDSLASLGGRHWVVPIIDRLYRHPRVEIISASSQLFRMGRDLFSGRPDQEWGLTDCTSFCVMEDRGITCALTADRHFSQAGYRALLLEDPA